MSDTRCPLCGRPKAQTHEDEANPNMCPRDDSGGLYDANCEAHAVDWRARALAAESERDRLRAFAQTVLHTDEGGSSNDLDEGVFDAAVEYGLLAAVEVTEPCDPENCSCAEYHGTIEVEGKVVFGDIVTGPDGVKREVAETVQCYRPTALLTGKS